MRTPGTSRTRVPVSLISILVPFVTLSSNRRRLTSKSARKGTNRGARRPSSPARLTPDPLSRQRTPQTWLLVLVSNSLDHDRPVAQRGEDQSKAELRAAPIPQCLGHDSIPHNVTTCLERAVHEIAFMCVPLLRGAAGRHHPFIFVVLCRAAR